MDAKPQGEGLVLREKQICVKPGGWGGTRLEARGPGQRLRGGPRSERKGCGGGRREGDQGRDWGWPRSEGKGCGGRRDREGGGGKEKVRLGIRNLSCANLDHQQGSTVGLGEAPDPLFLQRPDLDPVPGGGGTFLKAADGSWVKTRTLSVGKTLLLVWESE